MCKVSLVLPSLNVARYIEECLLSAINQELKEIEFICVDAGSTDGTLEIIRNYAERDKRIKLILSEKKSYGYQMNLGMQHASGEYIGILETDDFVPKNMYSELYEIAKRERADIVKADFYRFRTEGEQIERTYNRLDPSGVYYGKIINPAESPRVFRFIMNTWSGIYRRSFLEANGIVHNETPGASYQDNGFWFKTFCCAKRVYFVDKPYYMNRRDNEASSVANPGKVYCMTEEWAYIYDWLKEDAVRFRTFISMYTLRKFHSLWITYDRISPHYREEFVRHMSGELEKLIRAGEYDRKAFTAYEWRILNLIIHEPMGYHRICQSRCSHLCAANLLQRFQKRDGISWMIRMADSLINKVEMGLSWIGYEGFLNIMRRVKWKNTKDWINREETYG
ncbi:MAG: glycosyltransferase family 2 protein [Clostridia bacterium]|nr:glycosyltransferase family 2 protein [Clostridia bacterium]